ncbi:MAG: SpoIIE family protein phosphatase [Acidobacteria bacterium]|nr:SpoIIE family protein phosphatase [Acidobacteriota bacterium]
MPLPTPVTDPQDGSLDLLIEASEIVSRHSLDLDTLLEQLVELVRKVVDCELVAVLLKSGTDALRIRRTFGYRNDRKTRSLRVNLGEGITGAAARDLQTTVVPDVSSDPRYIELVKAVRSEMAVPLVARGKLVGVIDLQSRQLGAFGDREQSVLELIASRFSIAIDAARLYRATLRQNQTLRTLSEIAQEFNRLRPLDELLTKIASLIRTIIPYDSLSILLLEKDGQVLKHYFGVRYDERIQWDNVKLGTGIVGVVAETKTPVLVRDTELDDRYVAIVEGIRSEVAVPLLLKNKVFGVIDLESEHVGAFRSDNVQMLSLLSPQITTAIENAQLYEEVAHNKARMEQDLTAARVLQQNLLYAPVPKFPGVEIAVRNEAALEVAGDLYDFFPTRGVELGVLIGDVSGKGAAAALYSALVSGLVRNLIEPEQSSALLLENLNSALRMRRFEARYLTALYAQWRPLEGEMVVANAGQPRPLLCRDGKVEVLPVVGIPLGLLKGSTYEEVRVALKPGDLLVIASDGITEAVSPAGAEYDEKSLIQTVESHARASAEEIVAAIFEDVVKVSGLDTPTDDQTVIAIRIGESANL